MAIGDDFSITAGGDIRHVSGADTYSVLQFHRWLQDLADDAAAAGNDLVDITTANPSDRATDQIVTLNEPYNIDDTAAQFLYGGSIVQDGGDTWYSGLMVLGSLATPTTELIIVQNNALLTSYWGTGLNADATANILLRVLVKTRAAGADIDGRRVRVMARELSDTYDEFTVQLGLGEAPAAISTVNDDFNQTAEATIATWTDITNVEGYQQIDLSNGNGPRDYFGQWDRGTRSLNQLYERWKWLTRRGTSESLHGLSGALFRGITHQWGYTGEAGGPFAEDEVLSWGTGATAGTGVLLALDDNGATGTMWIQLLTGVPPAGSATVSGVSSSATATVGTVTARTVNKNCFGGAYTGNLATAFGVGVQPADVGASDSLRDLTDTVQTPPNNQSGVVSGLVVGEDYLLVTNYDAVTGIDYDQLSAAAGNTAGNGTLVVAEAIPSDTPASGTVRAWDATANVFRRLPYTSWSGSTFTLSGTLPATIAEGNDVFISYIDKLAASTSESFSAIYSSARTMFVKAKDGGATPTKGFEGTFTFGAAGGAITVQRVADA